MSSPGRESGQSPPAAGILPPLSRESWPRWESALLSPRPAIREPALFLLTDPVLNDELFHYRFLSRRLDRLSRIWADTGHPELLRLIITLINISRGEDGLDLLVSMALKGERGREVWEAAQGLADDLPITLFRDGSDLAEGVRAVLGGRKDISWDRLAAIERLVSQLGVGRFKAAWSRLAGLIDRGDYESACGEAGPEWNRLIEAAASPAPRDGEPGRLLIWDDLDNEALSFFDQILEAWARELKEVNRICGQVARRTGRLVIALFNADRAASLGWGLDKGSRAVSLLWPGQTTGEERTALRAGAAGFDGQVRRLKELWFERRGRPALEDCLTGLADWYRFNRQEPEFMALLERSVFTKEFEAQKIFAHNKPFTRKPKAVLEKNLDRVLTSIKRRLFTWDDSLLSWLALAGAAQTSPNRLGPPIRVMGLTEKFSASTAAGEDDQYLREWMGVLRDAAPEAIFLLFDDTSRSRAHLAEVAAKIPDCIGLGPFGSAEEGDPVGFITARNSAGRLFVLRILPQRGGRGDLLTWLNAPDPNVLRPGVYDPAWKEGLSLILEGTPQEVLTSPESPPARTILTSSGLWPVGAYCRRRLEVLV